MSYDYSRQPTHHPGCRARVNSSNAVILNPSGQTARPLDPLGTRIWDLADGKRSIHDIAVQLTREFDVNLDTARLCAVTFIESLADHDLFTWT